MADQLKKLSFDLSTLNIDAGDYLKYDENGMSLPIETVHLNKAYSLANNSSKNVEMWTPTEDGYAIISYWVEFPSGASGLRFSAIWNIADDINGKASQRTSACPNGTTVHSGCVRWMVTANKKIGIRVHQTSGSTQNLQLTLMAMFIPKDNS